VATTATTHPGTSFGDLMSSALGAVSAKIDDWTGKLNDVAGGDADAPPIVEKVADNLADGGSAKEQAVVRGVEASLVGRSPVWAAVKGAWAGAGTGTKAAIVAAAIVLVLLLVLSPVLLLLLLVAVPIAVVVYKVRSAKH